MLLISKKQLIPTDASLAVVFVCKLSKSSCKLVSLNEVSPILFMSRRLRYLLLVCSTWQKRCSGKYVVGKPSNISFTFPES